MRFGSFGNTARLTRDVGKGFKVIARESTRSSSRCFHTFVRETARAWVWGGSREYVKVG